MITPSLLSYIQQNLAAGKSKDSIKSELMLAGGWKESEVDQAFAALQTGPYKKSAGSKIASFFLTLLIIIIVLGGLAFAAEKYFGPTVSAIGNNIVAALPFFKKDQQPVQQVITPVPMPTVVQSPAVAPAPVVVSLPPPGPLVACKANDMNCLLQEATTCNPATETNTSSAEITTSPSSTSTKITQVKETTTRAYAITGSENNECTFKFTVKTDTIKANRGKVGACTLSPTDLATVLTSWNTGDFSDTTVDLPDQCTGTYFAN